MSHAHAKKQVTASEASLPEGHSWRKLPAIAGAIGVIGIVLTFVLAGGQVETTAAHGEGGHAIQHAPGYSSYLVAFMYFLSIALGGLFFTLVQFASRAGWSVVVRRLATLVAATLPVFLVLFVPIVLGREDLYHHWMHPGDDPILAAKAVYLNDGFFLVRAVVYLLIWSGLAWWYLKQSTDQDVSGDHKHSHAMAKGSYPALILFSFSLTFAAFDWMMSLDPHWFSTMFGVYYFAGTALSGFAILVVLSVLLKAAGVLRGIVTVEHEHDLGKFVFAFTVFWSYIAFSQFMLIWYAHIPEETEWFKIRMEGGWYDASLVLIICHFVVPFFLLMSRWVKRGVPSGIKPGNDPEPKTPVNKWLLAGALWMLAIHYVDMYWVIKPNFYHDGPGIDVADVTALIGVGGVFVAALTFWMSRYALVPHKDPRLEESLKFENI